MKLVRGFQGTSSEETYVAFLDILGFKDLVYNNSHKKLTELYESVIEKLLNKVSSNYEADKLKYQKDNDLYFLSVSDSIIIWTEKNNPAAFTELLVVTCEVLAEFFEAGIPLRGAISVGGLTSKGISREKDNKGDEIVSMSYINVVGSGIVNAYSMEGKQDWSGCIIDKKCIELFQDSISRKEGMVDLNTFIENGLINQYNVPKKKGLLSEEYVVNWPLFCEDLTENDVRNMFSAHNKNINDWSVENKISNTIKYVNYAKQIETIK